MSAPNVDYNQVNATTEKKFLPKLVDNTFDSSPYLQRIKKKAYERIDGGEKIVQPLEYAQLSSAGWYQGAETHQTADNDTFTAAEIDWKQLYVTVSVTRRDELKNNGTERVINFVKSKMKNAEKTMADYLGTGIYSDGTNAKSIVGVRKWVAASGSVGGISMTDNSWWQAHVDASTATFSIPAVQTQYMAASLNNDAPTVILSDKANYNRYHGSLTPQQRFQDSDTARGGFTNLLFNGVPWISDSYCPSNHIFGLNEDYLVLKVHEDEDMRWTGFDKPHNQNVKTGQIYWMGGMIGSNNRMHFLLNAVAA